MNNNETIRYYIIINDKKIYENYFENENNDEKNEKTKKNKKSEQKKFIELSK